MREDIKYRIREYCGEFTIQIYGYEEKGVLWWKRKEWSWYNTNAWGGLLQTSIYAPPQPKSRVFHSLESAEKQIRDWKTEPKYYDEN